MKHQPLMIKDPPPSYTLHSGKSSGIHPTIHSQKSNQNPISCKTLASPPQWGTAFIPERKLLASYRKSSAFCFYWGRFQSPTFSHNLGQSWLNTGHAHTQVNFKDESETHGSLKASVQCFLVFILWPPQPCQPKHKRYGSWHVAVLWHLPCNCCRIKLRAQLSCALAQSTDCYSKTNRRLLICISICTQECTGF